MKMYVFYTLSGTKTQDFNPYWGTTSNVEIPPFYMGAPTAQKRVISLSLLKR